MSIHELFICAHPDDEVIGAGGQFAGLVSPLFVQVTDGSPRDMVDAARLGYRTRQAYAQARREETKHALAVAGFGPERLRNLGLIDQEAVFELPALIRSVAELIREVRPTRILTHPYEGGHPDHDATAFAVAHACAGLAEPPPVTEMAFCHHGGSQAVFGEFLPGGRDVVTTVLSEAQCELKTKLLDCYPSQRAMLRNFPLGLERFRPAPRYDFSRPPHPGPLLYEVCGWGMSAVRWLKLARESLESPCAH